MNKIQKITSILFLENKKEPEGIDMVVRKCNDVIARAEVGSGEFKEAYTQLEKVKALKMAEAKAKKAPKIDPAIVGAGIGVAGQVICTAMIERYNADGHLFPMPGKSVTTGWLGLSGVWSKIGGLFKSGNK